jgi:hypothetical protein
VALGKLPYKQLRILLKDHLVLREDPETAKLIRELKQARRRGYLTPSELERICRWKSARAIHHIKEQRGPSANSDMASAGDTERTPTPRNADES